MTAGPVQLRPAPASSPPPASPVAATPSPPPPAGQPGPSSQSKLSTLRPPMVSRSYRNPGTNSLRFIRAYATTFQVIFSYTWLSLGTRFFGSAYRETNIARVHKANARRVYATILVLQGIFIKVGQLLSILANFLPEEFRGELEGLQDRVPPRPFSTIRPRVESELGKPLTELFATFHEQPIASASLGQVHEATLKDGTRVAVKVQHADIDEIVRLDLKTIRRILAIVQWFVPLQGLDSYYHQVKELLKQELDFAQEANSVERIAANFTANERVKFPFPIRSHSTTRVLTSTFVEGVRISDIAALDALGIDKKDLATRLVRVYCQMIFIDGIYHADPHPGNIMVNAEGDLILLDFGAVAELSLDMKEGIPEFLEGVIRRDTDRLIRSLRRMGFLSRGSDEATSEKIIEYFHRRFQEEVKIETFNLKDIRIDPQKGIENLLDLRRMDVGLRELSTTFHVPKDWVLLERTLLLVYGSCSLIDPELNPMGIVRPYLQEFVLGTRDFGQIAVETVRDMALSAITLPEDLRKYLQRAVRGEIEVRVRGVAEGSRAVYSAGRQIIYTSLAITSGLVGMHQSELGHRTACHVGYAAAGFFGFMLLMSSLLDRPRRG